jgi:prepilin-type N-terminal cleavage/methylation domain-containing protein
MRKIKNKSAFSLIELSIVLIIIGLLVAGITGGSSLIRSATLRSVMSEARGYGIAVNSFFVQYNSLPGDYNTDLGGIAAGYKGDVNNKIEFKNNVTTTVEAEKAESFGALSMLRQTKMLTTESLTAGTTASNVTVGVTIPQSKLKGSGWIFDYLSGATPTGVTGSWAAADGGQNAVLLVSSASLGTDANLLISANTKGGINAEDASSIDSKLDDGDPMNGRVRVFGKDAAAADCITTGSKYNVNTVKTNSCVLTYQVDVTS